MKNLSRLLGTVLLCCSALYAAAQGLTVVQLVGFMRSSIQQKMADQEVAKAVSRLVLTEKLDAATIEQLQGEGLGPKTVAALKQQMTATSTLKPAAVAQEVAKPAPIPPPSYEEEQKVISDMTDYALNYAKRLPDFLCTQVTRRYVDPRFRDSWINVDTVVAKVSFTEGHDNYELKLVNNTMVENKSILSLTGAISSGEFGSTMQKLFEQRTGAEFHFERWGKLRGKIMYVFNFSVEQSRSDYSIEFDRKERVITAYKGLVYVDKVKHQIQRLTEESVNIPVNFPVRATSSIIDYDLAKVGLTEYMLPMRAEVRMKDAEVAIRNNIEFRAYRKFGAESEIKYDDIPDPIDESKTNETPVKPEPPK